MTSDFTSTTPRNAPTAAYGASARSVISLAWAIAGAADSGRAIRGSSVVVMSASPKQRDDQERRQDSAGEDREDGNQRRELQRGETRDAVSRGAPAGIGRPEPSEKSTEHDADRSARRQRRVPAEQCRG